MAAFICYNRAKGGTLEIQSATEQIAEAARRAVEVASDKQAEDIILLDLRGLCPFADFFVICSGGSERQMKTIADEVDGALSKSGLRLHHREGSAGSGWMLLDFGDLIVHIFSSQQREFYQLDELWSQATAMVRMQ